MRPAVSVRKWAISGERPATRAGVTDPDVTGGGRPPRRRAPAGRGRVPARATAVVFAGLSPGGRGADRASSAPGGSLTCTACIGLDRLRGQEVKKSRMFAV